MFKRGDLYYFMAGSGCCYCAGGGDAMVFIAHNPLGPWQFQTNINDGLYLPFSPEGAPPPPPPLPSPLPTPAELCADLSGEWAWSVLVPNYQPLRRGIVFNRTAAPKGNTNQVRHMFLFVLLILSQPCRYPTMS